MHSWRWDDQEWSYGGQVVVSAATSKTKTMNISYRQYYCEKCGLGFALKWDASLTDEPPPHLMSFALRELSALPGCDELWRLREEHSFRSLDVAYTEDGSCLDGEFPYTFIEDELLQCVRCHASATRLRFWLVPGEEVYPTYDENDRITLRGNETLVAEILTLSGCPTGAETSCAKRRMREALG